MSATGRTPLTAGWQLLILAAYIACVPCRRWILLLCRRILAAALAVVVAAAACRLVESSATQQHAATSASMLPEPWITNSPANLDWDLQLEEKKTPSGGR